LTKNYAIAFKKELETFRKEEETAQQMFFAWLSLRATAASNADVLRMLNKTPLFWINAQHSMLVTAFVTLGRIFDQESKHNVDRLMGIVSQNLSIFSIDALRARKVADGIGVKDAARYIVGKHPLTSNDVKTLRKQIDVRRRIYEDRYRDIRHKVFAHKATDDVAEIDAMFAKTNIEEMKGVFGFLHALHDALWEQFHNGRKPSVTPYKFTVPPDQSVGENSLSPGERIFREGQATLLSMLSS
jgi:hypothetical protein